MTFADLPPGATFTGRPHPHFYEQCQKLGPRTYKGLVTGTVYKARVIDKSPYPDDLLNIPQQERTLEQTA